MSIGKQIKKLRKDHQLTQHELAAKANISRSYLGDIEGDRYNPSIETLKSLAAVLDIEVSAFFAEDTKTAPSPEKKDAVISEIEVMLQLASEEQRAEALNYLRKLLDEDRRRNDK